MYIKKIEEIIYNIKNYLICVKVKYNIKFIVPLIELIK